MITLPRLPSRDSAGPGWWPVKRLPFQAAARPSAPERTACMRCPAGHELSLAGHDIAADGKVTPSVVCVYDGCTFHEFVELEGFTP